MKSPIFLFDVDGVLMNSVPSHFAAWEQMFQEIGIDLSYDIYLTHINGLPREAGIRNIIPTASDKEVRHYADRKQELFLSFIKRTPLTPLPGVLEFLSELRKRNILFSAASSSKNAAIILERAGLHSFFIAIITGNDFVHAKPAPDIYLTAAKKMKVNPADCIVIEDAVHGIQAAHNAGMQTVGILSSNDPTIQQLATISISSLQEYPKILQYFL